MVNSILYFDPWGQFQGQNVGQEVITPKCTQIMKMMLNLNSCVYLFFKDIYFSTLTTSSKDMVI